jgi:hypothetical protein
MAPFGKLAAKILCHAPAASANRWKFMDENKDTHQFTLTTDEHGSTQIEWF